MAEKRTSTKKAAAKKAAAKKTTGKKAAGKKTSSRKAAAKKPAVAKRATKANSIDTRRDLGTVSASDFEPHLNQIFEAPFTDRTVALRLVAVHENPAGAHPNSARTPFSLIFHNETASVLLNGDGGYTLQREGFGRMENILITPIVSPGESGGKTVYQVCLS
ncbi:MAG: hypothetical protein RIB45_11345 [Marivibrio sp.]|uniref:DUF6916 family protein n=1 Tax=Marivibrio sp. TaxID=2039719 RepID=UPI0032EF8455